MRSMKKKKIQWFIKRLFDISFASFLLIFTSPILLIALVTIKILSPDAPAIYKQIRPGYNKKLFTIYKLRSMTNGKDADGNLLPDELRIKKWGNFIRSTNIDELPQMINIIKGEMSLIGPRPLMPDHVNSMSAEQQRRQDILPGISGWEAVNEAQAPTWEDKVKLDLYYIDNWSLKLDVNIFFKTIFILLFNRRPDDSLRAPQPQIQTKGVVKQKNYAGQSSNL